MTLANQLVSLLLEGEHITAAAVRLKDGTLLLGPTHSYCWDDALESGALDVYLGKSWEEFGHAADAWAALTDMGVFHGITDGFYTSTGRFVDRNEAVAVAQSADQLNHPTNSLDVDDMDNLDQEYGEVLREAAEPPDSYWVSPSNQLIKVSSHYALLNQKGLSAQDKASVDKVNKVLGDGPLAEEFYQEFEKAGWLRVVLCHKTKSVYFTGHARQAQQRVLRELAVEHQYRLVDDNSGEKVLWSPEDSV